MTSKKDKTYEQAEAMQAKAVRFLLDVVGDEEKAREIEGLSVDEYAERKGLRLLNPASTTNRTQRRNAMSIIYERNPATGEHTELELSQMSKPELLNAAENLAEENRLFGDGCERIADAVTDFEDGKLSAQELADEVWEALSEIDPESYPLDDDEEGGESEN